MFRLAFLPEGPSDGPLADIIERLFSRHEVVVDITEVYGRKRAAIACYSSQLERVDAAEATLANAPLNQWAFEARDGFHGAQIGVRHGEAYRLSGAVPIDDPIAHFRDGPGEALLYGPQR